MGSITGKEYRARATNFEARAQKIANPITRRRFLDIAQGWRELADLAEPSLEPRELAGKATAGTILGLY